MDSAIDSITTTTVANALDAAVARQALHAHNLANASTPGYRAKALQFEEAFDIESRRASTVAGRVVDTGVPVNLPSEVAAMSENSLHYQALVKLLNRHLSIAAIALNEGKR